MKRIISLMIVLVLVFSLTACGGKEEVIDNGGEEIKTSTEVNEEKVVENAEIVKDVEEKDETPHEYVLENEVILDNESCSITLVKCEETDKNIEFTFSYENKVPEKELTFFIGDIVTNGWCTNNSAGEKVESGNTVTGKLSIRKSTLRNFDLQSVDELRFRFSVYASDYSGNYAEDKCVVYPTGLTVSEIVSPTKRQGTDEQVIVDTNMVKFIILGMHEQEKGVVLEGYVENKTTDITLMLSAKNVLVNGKEVDPSWAHSVEANSKSYTNIGFMYSALEEAGIKSIEDVQFELRVYDEDTYGADILKDTFSYKPTK